MSRKWFVDRRPYAWSDFTDCSILAESNADWVNKRVAGKPAKYAGGDLQNKPRKIALLAPDNPEYQQCVHDALNVLHAAGNDATTITYSLDLASLSNQAASIVAKLKSEGITSVACGCDPILPVFLTAKAHEQNYYPEWLIIGVAGTDADNWAQLWDQKAVTGRLYGISELAATKTVLSPSSVSTNVATSAALNSNILPISTARLMCGAISRICRRARSSTRPFRSWRNTPNMAVLIVVLSRAALMKSTKP